MRVLNGCGKYEDLLARHLHGGALLQDREALGKHLAVCPDCANLHQDISAIDRALRDYPAKIVDPPPHLHSRIVASLPEELPPLWGGWGRWVFGFASLALGLVALFVGVRRLGVPPARQVVSAPATVVPKTQFSDGGTAIARRPAESVRTGTTPVLSAAPGGERRKETIVATAPTVQVIKEVKIFFYYPPARNVAVTGDFNDWNPAGVPLKAAGKPGLWETELRLPPGVYSYNFIVDGELLVPDPNSPNQMPDGYGGTNSLLLVKGDGSI